MGQIVQLGKPPKQISAYLAQPEGKPKGGVVVIQEIFGVNAHIRSVADRFAAAGYTAIAPALFDHAKPGVELGYTAEGIQEGQKYVGQVGFDLPIEDVRLAAEAIASSGKVGTVGFCWGGSIAYLAAIRLGLPGVSYYGGRNTQFVDQRAKAPLMFHYGARDQHISAEDRAKVQAANPDAPVHVYEADHGFNCDHRGSYDDAAAKLAMERTLAFFDQHLGA